MYQITITCQDCDGAGSIAMTSDLSSSMEHECWVCAGIGKTMVSEAAEMYEDTAALLEDYPNAIKIERVA
jgi:DnaJ-class molecular chaperone